MTSKFQSSVYDIRSRYYHGIEDLVDMQNLIMEARLQTQDWRFEHVGELVWNFFMTACHLNPHQFVRLWHIRQGKLVAYAILGDDFSLDFQVHPAFTGLEIEEDILRWAIDKVSDLGLHGLHHPHSVIFTAVYQDDLAKVAFLLRQGFLTGEYIEVNLTRTLHEPIPEVVLPEGFQVRQVIEEKECVERAGVQHDVWQPWSVGNIDARDYERLTQLPGYHQELDVVAVTRGGAIASYVNCWIDPVNHIGDFGPVGTRQAFRRQGLGRAVLLEGLRKLKACGMDRVGVSTGESNFPARALYETIGFKAVNRCIEYRKTI